MMAGTVELSPAEKSDPLRYWRGQADQQTRRSGVEGKLSSRTTLPAAGGDPSHRYCVVIFGCCYFAGVMGYNP